MSNDSAPQVTGTPRYVDSEDTNEHIRLQVKALADLAYDHDGHGALPPRPEVVDYVLHTLARPRRGLIRAAGVELPLVRLKGDGTFVLFWRHFDRTLKVHVPTRHVLLCSRMEDKTVISIKLGDAPLEDADELAEMFRWLAGDEC